MNKLKWELARTVEAGLEKIKDGCQAIQFRNKLEIDIGEIREIAALVGTSESCEGILFDHNGLGPEEAAELSLHIHLNTKLTFMNLWGNKIGPVGCSSIAKALEKGCRLRYLILDGAKVGDAGVISLSKALSNNARLTFLNLWNNEITDEGAVALADLLRSNNCLEMLRLKDNLIGNRGAETLADAIHTNSSIKLLDLDKNKISDIGYGSILNALNIRRNMMLFIKNNDIGANGGVAFVEPLRNSSLTVLILSGNDLNGKAFVSLIRGLSRTKSLQKLGLSQNGLGNYEALALSNFLKVNKSILELDLSKNHIDHNGAKSIADAILSNRTLIRLYVDSNKIKRRGTMHLANALLNNTKILRLRIKNNGGSNLKRWTDQIKKLLNRNEEILLNNNERVEKDAFASALRNGEKGKWRHAKIMVVGEGKAGKTSLVRALLGMEFKRVWESTLGASLSQIRVSSNGVGPLDKPSWSETKDEKHEYAVDMAHRMANIKMEAHLSEARKHQPKPQHDISYYSQNLQAHVEAMHDHNNRVGSEEKVGTQNKGEVEENIGDEEDTDLPPVMSDYDIQNRTEGMNWLRTAQNKSDLSYTIWDYAGQRVYYTLHHLFLTNYGVYCLVFSMQKMMDRDPQALEYVKFWLDSITLHAPTDYYESIDLAPIILIGTCLDLAADCVDDINTLLQTLIVEKYTQICENEGRDLVFFPVSNKDSTGLEELRDGIEEVTVNLEYMNTNVSIRWLRCLDMILDEGKTSPYLSKQQVVRIARGVGIFDNQQLENMLCLFHELGMVVYLTMTEILRDVVIVNPQWLLDMLSQVIRNDRVQKNRLMILQDEGYIKDLDNLYNHGIASYDLLERIWMDDHVHFLIDLMRQTLLLSDLKYREETYFVIPSLLTSSSDSTFKLESIDYVRCFFDFSSSCLPIGIFGRLVCLCISHADYEENHVEKPEIFKHSAKLILRSVGSVYLVERNESINLLIKDDEKAGLAVTIITSMLTKINSDIMGGGVSWNLNVYLDKTKIISYEEAIRNKVRPWFTESMFEEIDTNLVQALNID